MNEEVLKDNELELILGKEAYAQYEQVLKNKKKNKTSEEALSEDAVFHFMADQNAMEEEFSEALKYCNAAIHLNPKNEYYQTRGDIKRVTDDLEGAIVDYSTCIEKEPKSGVLYKLRGTVKIGLQDYSGAYDDMVIAKSLSTEGVTDNLIKELKEITGN
ncbi:tetratricopeptide repeat protein [Tenacibaculum ovolyticum]|uniref:hypothetical protein n=1 Tax=Tenacibaculum ovolyticum TaxID=104270 RepID=UPI0003F81573|nr:hypothetical protein [Tenacibaculum ovolyticum]